MDFKNYLILGLSSVVGSLLAWLISDETSPKKIAAKGVAGLMIGLLLVPAVKPYFQLPDQVWYGITAVSAVTGVEIIILLTQKLKEYLNSKIN